jgi:hypothetical protein
VPQVEYGQALVAKGLTGDETIVASGQADLSPGVRVAVKPGAPGAMNAHDPEIGPEGIGSTGINTGPDGIVGVKPR